MFGIRLSIPIIVFLLTLLPGRAESATASAESLVTAFSNHHTAAKSEREFLKKRPNSHHHAKLLSQADDELELPDVPEDAIPDDKGDADTSDGRFSLWIAWTSEIFSRLFVPGDGSAILLLDGFRQDPPRYLALCRLIC